jgi:hypothetical protein
VVVLESNSLRHRHQVRSSSLTMGQINGYDVRVPIMSHNTTVTPLLHSCNTTATPLYLERVHECGDVTAAGQSIGGEACESHGMLQGCYRDVTAAGQSIGGEACMLESSGYGAREKCLCC